MDTTACRGREGGREGGTELKQTTNGTGQRLCIWSGGDNCQDIFAPSTTAVQKSTVQ